MIKKILLASLAGAVVIGGIAALSAYEAHIINVTAHIENALSVKDKELEFGTVFPQEYLTKNFTISLSESFKAEPTADDVNYVIKQKPKPKNPDGEVPQGYDSWHEYCAAYPQDTEKCYLSLCEFLSKTDAEPADYNDTGVPSYYVDETPAGPSANDYCLSQTPAEAIGKLAKSQNDIEDIWTVDLKVPPVEGTVGQDWPAGCPTVPQDSQDYGCDLWIEVTHISRAQEPEPNNTVLSLENKDDQYWFVLTDTTYGTLQFNPASPTFDWGLSVNGLMPNTAYKLVYAPDPWPQSLGGLNTEIGAFTTDASGNWNGSGSINLGYDIPTPPDTNIAGGKIWVVLAAHHDGTKMTAWDHTKYLFEYNLINYSDTDN